MEYIRWMVRRDMSEVLAIEQQSSPYPWDEEEFLRCLRQRNCIGMVADRNEVVVGFMVYELHKRKLHILNIKTSKELNCLDEMLSKLKNKLSSHRRIGITIEVRESDLDLQLALRKNGFTAYAVNREAFLDSNEDGYAFKFILENEVRSEVGALEE